MTGDKANVFLVGRPGSALLVPHPLREPLCVNGLELLLLDHLPPDRQRNQTSKTTGTIKKSAGFASDIRMRRLTQFRAGEL